MAHSYVYIVESPSPRDLSDGRTEGLALCESFKLSRTKHTYTLAVNRDEFLRAFTLDENESKFRDEFQRHGCFPVVHLSMHGNDQGIGLTDGTMISWNELREILKPINEALPDGLMVTFSTCGGASSTIMSMVTGDEKPFFATVGSCDNVHWEDALVAYIVFYHNWLRGDKSAYECVTLMKAASGHDGFIVYAGPQQKQEYIAYVNRQAVVEALSTPPPSTGIGGLLSR